MSGFGSVSVPMATERSISVCERVPDDAGRIEDGAFDARAQVVGSTGAVAREHDAAVAAAKTAPHDLFERDLTRRTVGRGELRHRPHHWRRPADIQADVAGARR